MKKALTFLAIILFIYEAYNVWMKPHRKRLMRAVTERFGEISGIEQKSNSELAEMLNAKK